MARKLGPKSFSLEQELSWDDMGGLLDRYDMLRWSGGWWQAPPHFFDKREIETLIELDPPKVAAAEKR